MVSGRTCQKGAWVTFTYPVPCLGDNISLQVGCDVGPQFFGKRTETCLAAHCQRRHLQWVLSDGAGEETRRRGDGSNVVLAQHGSQEAWLGQGACVSVDYIFSETRGPRVTAVVEVPFQHLLLPTGNEELGGIGDGEES